MCTYPNFLTTAKIMLLVLCAPYLLSAADASTASDRQLKAEADLLAVKESDDPDKVVAAYNQFCLAHFGAEHEPMVYDFFGKELQFIEGGFWNHVSPAAAVISFETNLPSKSYVEYGNNKQYGKTTGQPERFYYLHQHQLTGLESGQAVHYRIVAIDERGNKITGEDRVLTPEALADAIAVPGDMGEAPYVLDKADAVYVLEQDITAAGTAFEVEASGVTLDLNGHTVHYCGTGIKAKDKRHLKIYNGRIIQGSYDQATADGSKDQRSPNILLINCPDTEIGGLYLEHEAPQESCIQFKGTKGGGICKIHHNVILDKGTKITNRHGSGVSELVCGRDRKDRSSHFHVHHNLVKRARQNGLRFAQKLYSNEIYIDSWSTNSFATGSENKNSDHHHNRVFATGYNAYAFPWSTYDFHVHHNFVHMQAIDTSKRWGEKWGDINMLSALRVTNYGKGGQERENLRYSDNMIIIRGRGKCEIRGTEFYSDETIKGLVCENNTIITESQDEEAQQIASVVAQGHFRKPDSLPVEYKNCRLISNICNVRFGDSYGKGNNHHFINCTFVKSGDKDDYHTFAFGGAYWNFGHVIRDCTFEPGTAYNDVWWKRTGDKSWYQVEWTLTLKAPPGAEVSIREKRNERNAVTDGQDPALAFEGTVDSEGVLRIPLRQCIITPPEKYDWRKGSTDKKEIACTPHTIEVLVDGERKKLEVSMDQAQELSVTF